MVIVLAIALLLTVGVESQNSKDNCEAKQEEPWSYGGHNGPSHWSGIGFPDCGKNMQSPIELTDAKQAEAPTLGYVGFSTPMKGIIKNNGHAIQLEPKDDVQRGFTLDKKFYQFQQMHFHFGSKSNAGSEHTIPGKDYVMELHLVHKNNDSGLAVLGLLFKEQEKNNKNLNNLIKEVKRVHNEGDKVQLSTPFDFKQAFPPTCKDTYYRYDGSLTTPPCSEGVKWFVFRDYMPIGSEQMKAFRDQLSTKKDENEQCLLQDNYRPAQPTNDRVVTLYNDKCKGSA